MVLPPSTMRPAFILVRKARKIALGLFPYGYRNLHLRLQEQLVLAGLGFFLEEPVSFFQDKVRRLIHPDRNTLGLLYSAQNFLILLRQANHRRIYSKLRVYQ